MKAIIQKSGPAKVDIDGQTVGQISRGLVILLGVKPEDTSQQVDWMVEKISNMRLFEEGEKHFDKSILENSKQCLVISQFTLYASCKKGRRPDFNGAARPEIAEPLYNEFVEKLQATGIAVETGKFGAMMHVSLVNEGPTTIILDTDE